MEPRNEITEIKSKYSKIGILQTYERSNFKEPLRGNKSNCLLCISGRDFYSTGQPMHLVSGQESSQSQILKKCDTKQTNLLMLLVTNSRLWMSIQRE